MSESAEIDIALRFPAIVLEKDVVFRTFCLVLVVSMIINTTSTVSIKESFRRCSQFVEILRTKRVLTHSTASCSFRRVSLFWVVRVLIEGTARDGRLRRSGCHVEKDEFPIPPRQ